MYSSRELGVERPHNSQKNMNLGVYTISDGDKIRLLIVLDPLLVYRYRVRIPSGVAKVPLRMRKGIKMSKYEQ